MGADTAATQPILLRTAYEPMPFWHYIGRRIFAAAYFRPSDLSLGLQPMWGGVALHVWPLMLAICDHRRMPSGPKEPAQ